MYRRLLLMLTLSLAGYVGYTQTIDVMNYRTIDGQNNNLSNVEWGAAGTNLLHTTGIGFADGISAPGGTNRPNPRIISNNIFAQNQSIFDPFNLSDFTWVWGQFLDHDIGLTPDGVEPAMIPVPAGDPAFDPIGLGTAIIPMMRNVFDPSTGTEIENPRAFPNEITAFIDGSGVYGSEEHASDWLRTFEGGKLKTSAGNMPPFNTFSGEFDDDIDPDAPHMDDAVGMSDKLFVCGDVRANENVLLLAFHTLFLREHNRLCDELAAKNPDWTDEQLYQHARKYVGGMIQAITFNEWLPSLGVFLPQYQGYDDSINPQLLNVFTAAAFRLGHTLLNSNIKVMDNDGNDMNNEPLQLRDLFFNPLIVNDYGGIEPFIKGMGAQPQQMLDAKIVNDVRNFLFGPPEAGIGGLDLASININRGRERGLADLNTVRQSFGLEPYSIVQEISGNAAVFIPLQSLYPNINNIDAWVGMLAEDPMPGAIFGETILTILNHQFKNLRDGDRFFYLNDPVLTDAEKAYIHNTTMHDIVMHNTGITLMQDEVFGAMPHAEICDHMTADFTALVATEDGNAIDNVYGELTISGVTSSLNSGNDGVFAFGDVMSCYTESLRLQKDDLHKTGVSIIDMIAVQRHLLTVEPLDSPYKLIAADVNNSGDISITDLVDMRRVILNVSPAFPNNKAWKFVPADYEFENPNAPWEEVYPEGNFQFDVISYDTDKTYIGIKTGDVNGDALNLQSEVDDRNLQLFAMEMEDQALEAGKYYTVPFKAAQSSTLEGFQFGANFDESKAAITAIEAGTLSQISAENISLQDNELRMAWSGQADLVEGEQLFNMVIVAKENVQLSKLFGLAPNVMPAVAYDAELQPTNLAITFSGASAAHSNISALGNRPNPFQTQTEVVFNIQNDSDVTLTVYDVTGSLIYSRNETLQSGSYNWALTNQEIPSEGVYFYTLKTNNESLTKKMIRQ